MINQSPHFNGPSYDPALDHKRLAKQHEVIRDIMLDGRFRTLEEIELLTGYPQASISAQLRHLKKLRFGAHRLVKRRRGDRTRGLYEYQILPPIVNIDSMGQFRFA
jgi:hypothetical protein